MAHGQVVSAQIIEDRESGRSKGFGFVEMANDAEADAAIAAGFDTQLATFREEVETVLAAKRQGEESAARRRDELARLGDRLEEAMNQLDDIVDEVAGL